MEDIANKIFKQLESHDGVQLVQIRFVTHQEELIAFRNGNPYNCSREERQGIGIRVRANFVWGFASTNDLSPDSIKDTTSMALKMANASANVPRKKHVELVDEPVHKDKYSVRIDKDPMKMEFEEKADIIRLANKQILETSKNIRLADSYYRCRNQNIHFYSSDGSDIEQRLMFTGASMTAIAVGNSDTQRRSLENFESRGWESVIKFDPVTKADQVAKDAITLVEKAKKCPPGKRTLILEPFQLGLTIHESCGHPAELDRVLGYEADFAGTSWLTPEKLGKLQYGNELINITQNPAMQNVLGHFKYDDEGVQSRSVPIIKKGIFVGYESDREHAALLNLEKSSGNSKADNYDSIPIIRMNNLYLEADPQGYKDINELIEDTKDGIFGLNWKSHSIDDKRLNFQFATQIGYRIENGVITTPLKNVTYQAITPEFWGACSGLTKTSEIYGLPYCGKGSPAMQVGYVSHGGPWGRFEHVQMGII